MPNGLPESIEAEIAGKRTPSSEDQPNNGGEPKKDDPKKEETPKDEPKKDEPKKAEKPEPKKGEAAKPKNGQSIAQVAAAADEEDDSDDEDDEDDHDGDDKKSKKRGSLFREYLDLKKSNKKLTKQYTEMGNAMNELVAVVKSLKGNKDSQIDEIEEFAEEWGLNKDGAKALVGLLEKKLSTKFKPNKQDDTEDDEDDEDEDDEPKKKVPKADPKKAELKARQIELAIEGEYEDFIDSFPDVKSKVNLKAIKRYIMGDAENLEKSFADIVTEMYPGVLDRKAALDGGSDAGNRDEDETPDWNDPKVQQKVQKDPKVREQYHSDLMGRVKNLYQ